MGPPSARPQLLHQGESDILIEMYLTRFIGQGGVHLHGGVGGTMEYRIGHNFKRLTTTDHRFGDADFHLARVAAMGGVIG